MANLSVVEEVIKAVSIPVMVKARIGHFVEVRVLKSMGVDYLDEIEVHLGSEGVFVGSGIFKSESPEKFARAIIAATTHYTDYALIASVSKNLGTAMKELSFLPYNQVSLWLSAAGRIVVGIG